MIADPPDFFRKLPAGSAARKTAFQLPGAIRYSVIWVQGMLTIWFRVVLVFAMAMPMLVLYANSALGPFLTRDLHLEPELLGYLVMSSFGLASVLSLWAGAFVDRVGSRYSLIVLFRLSHLLLR